MDLRAHRVDALVLRAIAYGEADAVVHLLVRGRGRISAFARGARSSRKRFGGALEPFQRVEALVAEMPGRILDHDRAHLNEIADLLTDLMPAHPMIGELRGLAQGGPKSSKAA